VHEALPARHGPPSSAHSFWPAGRSSLRWLPSAVSSGLPICTARRPVGIALGLALAVLAACLLMSPSLRGLLTNQRHLILLNLWRLVGVVFLVLMANGQMPALWALPAGTGDVIVGATAPWIARHVDTHEGKRRAIIFTVFGMADLVVAVGLGVMTSPGPAHVFRTTPTSELATEFPLALVPTFLVPLAFTLHVISLWQLLGGSWATQPAVSSVRSR
jgi:hypothetical protein